MVRDMRVSYVFSTLTLSTWELVLDDTVHGKDNLEEKTREDADNRMYYLRLNMFNKDVICCCDGGWHESFSMFSTQHEWPQVHVCWWSSTPWTGRITWTRIPGRSLTCLTGCVTLVELFFNWDVICCGDGGWHQSFFYIFNMSENIKFMCFGGQRSGGWQGQPWGCNDGVPWHHDHFS